MNNKVYYTSKTGYRVDADTLRLSLDIIADDIDTAELIAREAGNIELANALDSIFHDVDRLTPGLEAESTTTAEGGQHE